MFYFGPNLLPSNLSCGLGPSRTIIENYELEMRWCLYNSHVSVPWVMKRSFWLIRVRSKMKAYTKKEQHKPKIKQALSKNKNLINKYSLFHRLVLWNPTIFLSSPISYLSICSPSVQNFVIQILKYYILHIAS